MRIVVVLLMVIILSGCQNDHVTKEVKPNVEKSLVEKCILGIDTFSFKGIRLGELFESVEKKHKFKKSDPQQFTLADQSIYNLEKPEELTVFGYKVSRLTIFTLKKRIYCRRISNSRSESSWCRFNIAHRSGFNTTGN